ncbi:hypothetical protein OAI26_03665 [Sulfitobacter sp.]|nr:hypothetical protein [Sulfitobacter sp.]
MAGIFAPKLQSEVAYERPVEQPSMLGALAGLGGDFLQSYSASQRRSRGASGSTKPDPQLGTFAKGLERVEAIRNEKGEQAALIAERQLATNFAMQGVEFDTDYQNVYTKTTGRVWAGYGRDNEDFMREQALQDSQVQASYVASYALLPQDSTDEQRIEYAIGQKATLQASADVIARSKAEQGYQWSVQTEAAYGTAIDTFLNTNLGALVSTQKQGGTVGPQALANLGASWSQLKVGVSRPSGVSDDQWKSTQAKITSIDNLLTTLTKASSSDVLFEEITRAFASALIAEGGGSTESILAAASAIKDPASLRDISGLSGRVDELIMKVGRSLNLEITQPQLFGHIAEQTGLGETVGGNITLDKLPASIASKVEGLSPQQFYDGLEASGQLTKLTDASALQRPEGRQQFVENSAGIGAVLMGMGNDDFLSASFLKELVGNRQFIQNVKTLDSVDPEGATVARTYVRSGLNTELVRQQRNLAAVEATSTATWNGSNYVIDQEQLRTKVPTSRIEDFNRSLQKNYGGDILSGVRDGFRRMNDVTDVVQLAGLYNLEGAVDRRDAIGVINETLKGLAVEEPETAGQTQNNGVQSTTASLIERYESGRGGYDTLFNQAQGSGGPFEGFNVSQKTLGELYEFSNPSGAQGTYGAYVKATNPKEVLATPMGRFQFIGSTLKEVAKKMGLPDDTVFNKETQDAVFLFHVRDVMAGKSQEGKIKALRNTWDGFNNASDAELIQMIAEVEGGNPNLGGGGTTTPEYTPRVTTTELPPANTAPEVMSTAPELITAPSIDSTQPTIGVGSDAALSRLLPEELEEPQSQDTNPSAVVVAEGLSEDVRSFLNRLDEDIPDDKVTELLEYFGIRTDTEFGNMIANSLTRSETEQGQKRKAEALRYFLDQLER